MENERYVLVHRRDGIALAAKWIDDATDYNLPFNSLREIDFEPFRDDVGTDITLDIIQQRNRHLVT